MHVHASMTLAPGKDQEVTDLLTRSLPLIARLEWKLTASFLLLNGPTRTILNLWDIPDANAFISLPAQLGKDAELLQIMIGLDHAMIHNELTLMNQTAAASSPAGAMAPGPKTVYLRETVTALPGKASTLAGLFTQAVPLLEKRGWRFLGSWGRATGVTGMMMNLWQLPDSARNLSIHDLIAEDPEVAKAFAAIAEVSSQVEMTYLRKMPYSP